MQIEILDKLQTQRGYQGCRIRPYPSHDGLWLAEGHTFSDKATKTVWRVLRDEKTQDYKTFTTPEQAYTALVTWRMCDFS